jgi:hypothetical protein
MPQHCVKSIRDSQRKLALLLDPRSETCKNGRNVHDCFSNLNTLKARIQSEVLSGDGERGGGSSHELLDART